MWNVNTNYEERLNALERELIETLWNVNKEILISNTQDITELIETLWNVNKSKYSEYGGYSYELIETLWNVNSDLAEKRFVREWRINRNIVECKSLRLQAFRVCNRN